MKDKTAVLNLFSQHGIKSEIDFHALTLAQAAALNHMEQQLQEFLINGLYDELQEYFQ